MTEDQSMAGDEFICYGSRAARATRVRCDRRINLSREQLVQAEEDDKTFTCRRCRHVQAVAPMLAARRVHLEWYELHIAAQVGIRRQLEARRAGKPDAHGFVGEGWDIHIEGAAAEMAVAKCLGLYWDGSINTFKAPDVGRLHVRRRSIHHYDLIIRRSDEDDGTFLLVTGSSPDFLVHGWCKASEAKTHGEWLCAHGGREEAWFVPKEHLHSVEELSLKLESAT